MLERVVGVKEVVGVVVPVLLLVGAEVGMG